jgi:TadE-like protein
MSSEPPSLPVGALTDFHAREMRKVLRQTFSKFRGEQGQSFVEFAFILPFLVFLVLAIVQFGRAWHNYLTITDAARVGAREGAVHRTTACTSATTKISSLGVIPAGSSVTCSLPGGAVTGQPLDVQITYSFSIGLPGYFGVPPLSRTFTLVSNAKERLE